MLQHRMVDAMDGKAMHGMAVSRPQGPCNIGHLSREVNVVSTWCPVLYPPRPYIVLSTGCERSAQGCW